MGIFMAYRVPKLLFTLQDKIGNRNIIWGVKTLYKLGRESFYIMAVAIAVRSSMRDSEIDMRGIRIA